MSDETDDQVEGPEAGEGSGPVELDEDPAVSQRLWIRTLQPLLDAGPADEVTISPRVRFAIDRMKVAAAERLVRILRSDLAAD